MIVNGHLISVNYSPGAGGNFLQNCLGLSRHCVLRDKNYIEWQLTAPVDAEFYQQKLAWVLDTIQPGTFNNNWVEYELGSHRMFGFKLSSQHTDQDIPKAVHQAAEHGAWVTHGVHSHAHTSNFICHWPEIKYINVVGWQWARRWREIKKHRPIFGNQEPQQKPTQWEPSPNAYEFDFDTAIQFESSWLQNIQRLFNWLNWQDFDQVPVAEYYRAYKLAHDRQA